MYLLNHTPGRRYAPLETLEIHDAAGGALIVSDGARRVYLRTSAADSLRFTVGGAAGLHTILHVTAANKLIDRVYFQVEAVTQFDEASGVYRDLFAHALYALIASHEHTAIRWNGEIYRTFAPALRDHVGALRAMIYFDMHVRRGLNLFRDSQRNDGMVWSGVVAASAVDSLQERFADGDFLQPFTDGSAAFSRIPVEADTEAVFVTGVYAAWQATGDDGWMQESLDAAVRSLDYSVHSPYRWSEQFGLIKRGYTIDNGNVLAQEERSIAGDAQRITPEQTRFGIMFGDNTAYIAACRALAAMLDHAGRSAEAERFRERADSIQAKLDQASWEGGFFIHHVPEQYGLIRDFGVDEDSQFSQSNAFSLNRGISHEQATAIIQQYQALRNTLAETAPAEWVTIYPPFAHGFGAGQTNGGASVLVAGELARGAFAHGFEGYAVDILNRVAELAAANDRTIHAFYPATAGEGSAKPAAAAVINALIEGLAGVNDQAAICSRVLVAPRWLAAGVDEAQVTVGYPASGGYLAYRYQHNSANRQLFLTITGSGERANCHVLLPTFAQKLQITLNDAPIAYRISTVEQSRYADFDLDVLGVLAVTVEY